MKRILVVWAALACTPFAGFAQSGVSWTKAFEDYVHAHGANGDFTGNILVSQKGKVVFEKSYGFASSTFGVRNGPSTRFVVASVTKTFTAAAIILLRDEGKLKIEDSISRFFPDFPRADEIKIRHLLAHQSGLQNPEYDDIAGRTVAPEELMAMIASKPLLFKPGEQSRYSNAGYVVLANVVQKASGMAFCDYLRSKIFAPLGMRDTGCVTSGTIISQLAEGYVPGAGIELLHAPVRDPSSLFGSGNVYSTAHDLDLWLRAVDGKLLFDIARLEYPFGWGKRKWYGRDLIVQSGIAAGYSSIILTVPAEQLNITIVMNTQSGFTADEGKTPLGFVYGELASPPVTRPTTSIAVPADKLAAYSGNYVFPQGQIPMHIQATNGSLALRWDHSTSLVELTPLSQNEFLDRSSFGKIVFEPERLFWVDKERKLECPKQQGQ